ncbi:putative phosphoribosyltransferase [Halobacteriovorax marinus SJ]|uniref:Hypoxanthine phosphoribosyltransferase n=1 Tax=Halobacteriovorax marinus (strain ATCC BAA-682 / DSM 15412 / SJ) TaxID=862908 RepID=E1X5Q1_HALMS|nr:hypoxanthine phosphoribosyltransferase [Halobacteriovorax marinus]CBW25618.1 putative phosphoribosyltransferase [Halobacteriovorax marinus SJ]
MSFPELISREKIHSRVQELAKEIERDFAGEEIIVVGVLKGSFIFCADLIREINLPITLDFISVSSYEGTESTGELKINLDIKSKIEGKNVILVEDIIDTGLTISSLITRFKKNNPKSLKVASLLYKPARIQHKVDIDYLAFEIEDHFVIGYGLDFNGSYRELPYVGIYNGEV